MCLIIRTQKLKSFYAAEASRYLSVTANASKSKRRGNQLGCNVWIPRSLYSLFCGRPTQVIAWKYPTAMLPGTNGITAQPSPEGAAADLGDDALSQYFVADVEE